MFHHLLCRREMLERPIGNGRLVAIYGASTARLHRSFPPQPERIAALAFSARPPRLVAAPGGEKTVHLFSLPT